MSRRAFVVSELYYPEDVSTGHFLTGIAEAIAADRPTRVLCAQPTYAARGTKAPWRETRNRVDIQRCPAITADHRSLFGKLLNLVSISLSLFVAGLLSFRRGDMVIVVTNPPLLPYLTAGACWLRGARLVVLVHDVYPEVLVAAGLLRRGAFVTWAFDRASRWLCGRAERVIVLGRDMEQLLTRKCRPPGKLVVIPNWGDLDSVVPTARAESRLLGRLGLSDGFVIQYSGNIGRCHAVESLVEAAALLQRSYPSAHLLVIGRGARRAALEAAVRSANLENVTLLDYQPRQALGESLNACDLAVVSLATGMSGISVPSRTYNILAAGKPVLAVCDFDSEVARIVREEQIGWVASPDRPAEIASAIADAASDRARLRAMGARARLVAERKYGREHVAAEYRRMLRDLANE